MVHFDHVMLNVSHDDVIAGKQLHAIYGPAYGRSDLESRVTLTNKNVIDRTYIWYKYKTARSFNLNLFLP